MHPVHIKLDIPITSRTRQGTTSQSHLESSSPKKRERSDWMSVSDEGDEDESCTHSVRSYTKELVGCSSRSDSSSSPLLADASTQTELTLDDISFYESLCQQTYQSSRSLQAERMKSYRLRKKVTTLKRLIEDLEIQSLITHDFVEQLHDVGGNDMLSNVENELLNRQRHPQQRQYSDDIKTFSLTVYFHSPAAYRFLRTRMTLPHERTLARWLMKTDGSPGFTDASLQIIKARIDKGEIENECVLIIDSMSIRKQIIYSPTEGRNLGYVDIGIGEDATRVAGESLVFLVNGLKSKWRYPIGYFLVGK